MNLFYTTMPSMEVTGFSFKKFIFTYSFILFIVLLSSGQAISQYSAPASASVGQGGRSTAVGEQAGNASSTGGDNSVFGQTAGNSLTSGTCNSFFGTAVGKDNTSGSSNSFFGSESGSWNETGDNNSFFGSSSGRANTLGNYNSFFGAESGDESSSGSFNSFFGAQAGFSTDGGSSNSFFGFNAGHSNTPGSRNSFFGERAGHRNRAGNENTSMGFQAGATFINGSNNICIGSNAGPSQNTVASQRLYIDIERTDLPLIYAEFDSNHVVINGTFEVTAGLSNPSDVNLKENFEEVDVDDILSKVVDLDITKWNYNYLPTDRHIGTTAQQFRQAFNLGADDRHISTIDADGVALASIQALYKENQEFRKDNDELRMLVKELANRISKLEANK